MAIRKNASSLSTAEIDTFVSALKELKRRGRYDLYVLQHAQAVMSNIHRCPAFLTWHRQLLWELEKELQEIANDPNLGLPYWHWGENAEHSNPEDYPMWAENFMGPGGRSFDGHIVKSGPFREGEWTIVDMQGNPGGPLVRALGQSPVAADLPTREQIEAMLRVMPFDVPPYNMDTRAGFRNLLEGWYGGNGPLFHNRGHVWMGGSMIPMTSPNDPVFFLHHCFVDKLWWDWQQRHGSMEPYLPTHGGRVGQNLNDAMESGMTGSFRPFEMLNITELGYSYDAAEPAIETSIVFTQVGAPDTGGHDGHGDNQDTDPGDDEGDGNDGGHDDEGHGDNDGNDDGGTGHDTGGSSGGSIGGGSTSGGSGGNNTGGGTTSGGGRGRGRGCMLSLLVLILFFVFACSGGLKSSKVTGFEMYENKTIVSSVYWYFDISPGEKDVYKVLTNQEDIYFEVEGGQTSFRIEGAQMETSNVKVVTKNNVCFLGKKGKIVGQLNGDQLDLELDFESQSAKSNAEGELIIKDAFEKELHGVKVKGVCARVVK